MNYREDKDFHTETKKSSDLSSWEQRSLQYGTSLQGVLFKNLPEFVNEHIHQWHLYSITTFLKNKQPKTLLDVGCGYGRLSASIINQFPGIQTTGLDISPHYAELYRQQIKRPAIVSTAENIPNDLGEFDCILAVTVLMYVPENNLSKAVSNLVDHLNKNGTLIIIENHCSGCGFQNPFGLKNLLKRPQKKNEINTGGRCFRDKRIADLVQQAGGQIDRKLKMPVTSIFILPIYAMAKILPEGFNKWILKIVSCLDKSLGSFPLPSLHAAYLVTKKIP